MKINIYYGGRGVLDDPTLGVLEQVEQVLGELRVEIGRYNIYEQKNKISTLPQTIRGADGIILATTVEWLGIGGNMTQFLDALWLYGDKEEIEHIYMQPIVISTTYGEREGILALENAWEILGGQLCEGLCGYAENLKAFKENSAFAKTIEKKVENFYRTISRKTEGLPCSNQAVRRSVLRNTTMKLTPQESDQLSVFVSNDNYVARQKQDISDLSAVYKDMLGEQDNTVDKDFVNAFLSHFKPFEDFKASYAFEIEGKPVPLVVSIDRDRIECGYKNITESGIDVIIRISIDCMNEITNGRMTFTRAFNSGKMSAKGQFSTLRKLDEIFVFAKWGRSTQ
ncbi:MAG: SCP2 sterol-binding domain-containing protein [Lachnospiraceae bacterium]|nr:SCP2 sterol-binding domain-containing protein [Lachnospiraceae bacterium]